MANKKAKAIAEIRKTILTDDLWQGSLFRDVIVFKTIRNKSIDSIIL